MGTKTIIFRQRKTNYVCVCQLSNNVLYLCIFSTIFDFRTFPSLKCLRDIPSAEGIFYSYFFIWNHMDKIGKIAHRVIFGKLCHFSFALCLVSSLIWLITTLNPLSLSFVDNHTIGQTKTQSSHLNMNWYIINTLVTLITRHKANGFSHWIHRFPSDHRS